MLKKISLAIFLFFCLFYAPRVYAVEEFASSYDVLYDIDSAGIATVTEKINLKNLTSESYADQFKLIIGATQVFDIKASDAGGNMQIESEKKDNSTIITVKFNQQVVGLNKSLPWTLQFKSKDFAQSLGKVWEVRAPKVSSTTALESYNLTIAVPTQFGEPTTISPTPLSQTTSFGKIFLTFNKDKLLQSGVSANFGDQQLFDFDLSYHLENTNLVPVLTSIAMPPDTAYQNLVYRQINPTPLNVTVDEDGNYLAWFKLKQSEKMDVKVLGSVKLFVSSRVKTPQLDVNLRKKYTQADKYWEADHPQILNKLAEILKSVSNSQDNKAKVKAIYQYVVNSLKYDPNRLKNSSNQGIERLGAVTVLNNPNSTVCMEFTDLFIALARAADIPARELDGYAYTANKNLRPLSLGGDILHAWPEYWDEKKGWTMVDPTWENTTGGVDYFSKLDLNHFVFVTKGFSSEHPIPAGSYKYSNQDTHDVKVELSENDFLGVPRLDVKIDNSQPILAGFPGKIRVQVKNVGNSVYPSNIFLVESNKLSILGGTNQKLGSIPPFGYSNFDYNIRSKGLFDNFTDQITVMIGSQKYSKDVAVKPFLIFQSYPVIAFFIISLMVIVYLIILSSYIYKAKFKSKK